MSAISAKIISVSGVKNGGVMAASQRNRRRYQNRASRVIFAASGENEICNQLISYHENESNGCRCISQWLAMAKTSIAQWRRGNQGVMAGVASADNENVAAQRMASAAAPRIRAAYARRTAAACAWQWLFSGMAKMAAAKAYQ
jgi:hypothetical protein